MLDPADVELLQRHQDMDTLPSEVERVEMLLAGNGDARQMAAALTSLAKDLEAGAALEPADGAVQEIMRQVRTLPPLRRFERTTFVPGRWTRAIDSVLTAVGGSGFRLEDTMPSRSRIVWGMSSAAVLVLAALWITGLMPQVPEGADATIGGARRNRTAEGVAREIASGDAHAQAFMNSEAFDRILKDSDVRWLLSNAEVRTLFADARVNAALEDPDFAVALNRIAGDPTLARLSTHAEWIAALSKDGIRSAPADVEMHDALAAALSSTGTRTQLAGAGFLSAVGSTAFQAALKAPGFSRALQRADFASALARAEK